VHQIANRRLSREFSTPHFQRNKTGTLARAMLYVDNRGIAERAGSGSV
jgi:hypothetical protein